jgi:hypothetical protein
MMLMKTIFLQPVHGLFLTELPGFRGSDVMMALIFPPLALSILHPLFF